jgi:DNA polymerase-4
MHIDFNSCFASIEQQANPFLRGKPTVVAAYATNRGCVLAASREAKALGIKTGMRIFEAKNIYPRIIVLPSDPDKYREVHRQLKNLLSTYSDKVNPKSIDEFSVEFYDNPTKHALEIKQRIRDEIGEFLTVSIGISTNRYLAKVASNLKKPDGLEEINATNFLEVFSKLKLTDLTGIKSQNAKRLIINGVYSVVDFYNADPQVLKTAFGGIDGYYWHLRLHGFEVDEFEVVRKTFGNSYALPEPFYLFSDLTPIIQKLVDKTSFRLRTAGYLARGIHLGISYRDHSYWHKGRMLPQAIFATKDVFREVYKLLEIAGENGPVRELDVSVFNLESKKFLQLDLENQTLSKLNLVAAVDKINNRYGMFTLTSAAQLTAKSLVPDRIAFGGVREI